MTTVVLLTFVNTSRKSMKINHTLNKDASQEIISDWLTMAEYDNSDIHFTYF